MRRSQHLTVAAAMVGLLSLGACSSDASDPPRASAASPSVTTTAAPTGTPTRAVDRVIDYGDTGIVMTSADDVNHLNGASEDFKTYIAAELAKDQATNDEACTEKPQIYVTKLDIGGWAAGGHFIPQCGGYATLWAKSDGAWKDVWRGQELVDCDTLTQYKFPADVVGRTCLQGSGEVPYRP